MSFREKLVLMISRTGSNMRHWLKLKHTFIGIIYNIGIIYWSTRYHNLWSKCLRWRFLGLVHIRVTKGTNNVPRLNQMSSQLQVCSGCLFWWLLSHFALDGYINLCFPLSFFHSSAKISSFILDSIIIS